MKALILCLSLLLPLTVVADQAPITTDDLRDVVDQIREKCAQDPECEMAEQMDSQLQDQMLNSVNNKIIETFSGLGFEIEGLCFEDESLDEEDQGAKEVVSVRQYETFGSYSFSKNGQSLEKLARFEPKLAGVFLCQTSDRVYMAHWSAHTETNTEGELVFNDKVNISPFTSPIDTSLRTAFSRWFWERVDSLKDAVDFF